MEELNNIRTIQVSSPHEHKFKTEPNPDTYKHITPQPSTPIKHAGSELLIRIWDIGKKRT